MYSTISTTWQSISQTRRLQSYRSINTYIMGFFSQARHVCSEH